jgi:hypothetical protein
MVSGREDDGSFVPVSNKSEIGTAFDLDPDVGTFNRYYYDSKRDKLRIIHAEYRLPKKIHYLINPQTGISEEVSEGLVSQLDSLQLRGMLAGLQPTSIWKDYIYTVEWVGTDILSEGPTDAPFDGFSVVPYSYAIDSESGTAYGMLRNLFDPQMEINKAHSASLEILVGQSKPGVIAEEGAIPDVASFEQSLRVTGSVAIAKVDALASNRVRDRTLAQFSPAITERLERSVEMLDRISNIATDLEAPSSHAEAAATVQLRHRKSILSMIDVQQSFERWQKSVMMRVLQAIVKEMPDSQMTSYLGNNERFKVQGGTLYEMGPSPQDPSQKVPVGQVPVNDVRSLRYDVTLEIGDQSGTYRLMELQSQASLLQLGVPIDPVVLVEKAATSRSERERLKKYAENASRSQMMSAQQQGEAATKQIEATLKIEAQKAQEAARHNQVTEQLQAKKQQDEVSVRFAGILQKADNDEKRAVTELMNTVEQRQARREQGIRGQTN